MILKKLHCTNAHVQQSLMSIINTHNVQIKKLFLNGTPVSCQSITVQHLWSCQLAMAHSFGKTLL